MKEIFKYLGAYIAIFFILILGGLTLIINTHIKRKVFENSHQYHESKKEEILIYEAQLQEINTKLSNPHLDKTTRNNLESQSSAIRIRLNAARNK